MSPRKTSSTTQLLDFFTGAPEEWLTIEDAAAKLGCPFNTAKWAIGGLVREGHLERVSVYRLKTDPATQEVR